MAKWAATYDRRNGPRVAEEVVHVTIRLTSALDDHAISEAVEQLSEDERARHDRFVFDADRRDFAVAHALLRQSLSAVGDRAPHEWKFTEGRHGKSRLVQDNHESAPLSFNITHTSGLVACVIARDAEVGIDAETLHRRIDLSELPDDYLSPFEIETLAHSRESAHTRFLEMWTLKEACLKTLGEGLSARPRQFSFLPDDASGMRVEPADVLAPHAWSFAQFAIAECYRIAVAVRGQRPARRRLVLRCDPALADVQPIRTWNNNASLAISCG
jgi:4'-phosphopantetheinyl transferase